MKTYIDVSVLTLATFITGIQRVTREVCVRLVKEAGEDIVLMHYNAAKDVYYRIDNTAFVEYYVNHKGIKEKMITNTKVRISEICDGSTFFDIDAAWMGRVKRSYLLPVLKKQGAYIISHIYDVIPITHPQYCLERGIYNFADYFGAHMQYADEVIVNAKATEDEILRLSAKIGFKMPHINIIPLGADFKSKADISKKDVPASVLEASEKKPYILTVGTIEPRKNHKLLLEAYDLGLKKMGYRIIMAGYMGWNMEDFEKRLGEHQDFGKEIFHFKGLDDNAVSYLYSRAKFLAFCSYTEGFGLPIIEAIKRKTPVIASDIPVSREVAGDYCVWFEQDNARDFCDKIREYTENNELYEGLKGSLNGFRAISWDEAAGRIAGICLLRR